MKNSKCGSLCPWQSFRLFYSIQTLAEAALINGSIMNSNGVYLNAVQWGWLSVFLGTNIGNSPLYGLYPYLIQRIAATARQNACKIIRDIFIRAALNNSAMTDTGCTDFRILQVVIPFNNKSIVHFPTRTTQTAGIKTGPYEAGFYALSLAWIG